MKIDQTLFYDKDHALSVLQESADESELMNSDDEYWDKIAQFGADYQFTALDLIDEIENDRIDLNDAAIQYALHWFSFGIYDIRDTAKNFPGLTNRKVYLRRPKLLQFDSKYAITRFYVYDNRGKYIGRLIAESCREYKDYLTFEFCVTNVTDHYYDWTMTFGPGKLGSNRDNAIEIAKSFIAYQIPKYDHI